MIDERKAEEPAILAICSTTTRVAVCSRRSTGISLMIDSMLLSAAPATGSDTVYQVIE
jgi:hypothetical protein